MTSTALTRLPDTLLSESIVSSLTSALSSINFEPPRFDDRDIRELTGIHRLAFETDPFITAGPTVTDHDDHLVLQVPGAPRVAAYLSRFKRWAVLTAEGSQEFLAWPDILDVKGREAHFESFDFIDSIHRTQEAASSALRALPEARRSTGQVLDDVAQEFSMTGLKFLAVGAGIRDYRQRRGEEERRQDAVGEGWD